MKAILILKAILFLIFLFSVCALIIYIWECLKPIDAVMQIDMSDKEKVKYNFIVLVPIDDVQNHKYLKVKVKVL